MSCHLIGSDPLGEPCVGPASRCADAGAFVPFREHLGRLSLRHAGERAAALCHGCREFGEAWQACQGTSGAIRASAVCTRPVWFFRFSYDRVRCFIALARGKADKLLTENTSMRRRLRRCPRQMSFDKCSTMAGICLARETYFLI